MVAERRLGSVEPRVTAFGAIAIATGKPYLEVYEELTAPHEDMTRPTCRRSEERGDLTRLLAQQPDEPGTGISRPVGGLPEHRLCPDDQVVTQIGLTPSW
jgi:hypothetical protein